MNTEESITDQESVYIYIHKYTF